MRTIVRTATHFMCVCVVVVVLLACGSDNTTGPTTQSVPIEVTATPGLEGFAADLDALRIQLRIPGMSAAIAYQGDIIWSTGLGQADAATGRAATPTTPFHLASLTKPFDSIILMQLVEEGLVDLDDPVTDYGVNLSASGVILVRHLLSHTSEGVPGAAYSYNGNRFGNLDRVIEVASGRSFAELVAERILGPLALTNTAPNPADAGAFAHSGLDRTAFMADMAAGYDWTGSQVLPIDHPGFFGTAAGMVASAEDMATFSIAIDEGRFLAADTWDRVFTPAVSNTGETLPYALGWFIQDRQDITFQWYYGWWTSNSSLIVRVPERELTFVVLANTNYMSRAYGLGGDSNVLRSDVARLFIEAFVFGDEPLPREVRSTR